MVCAPSFHVQACHMEKERPATNSPRGCSLFAFVDSDSSEPTSISQTIDEATPCHALATPPPKHSSPSRHPLTAAFNISSRSMSITASPCKQEELKEATLAKTLHDVKLSKKAEGKKASIRLITNERMDH